MQDEIVERTARLTERAIAEAAPAFVAWPETALPDVVSRQTRWTTRVTQLVGRSGTTVVTGGVELDPSTLGASRRYNAAFAFTPEHSGEVEVVHRKQKLVPVIEQVPNDGMNLSRTRFGGFTPGREVEVSTAAIGRYGTLLCYELTFPGMARELRRKGADVLVTLSNDAWFRRTAASHQHFAHAILRAVENRVTVVRAANTGVSGIVDPLGRVVTETRPFEATYATGRVQHVQRAPLAAHIGGLVGPFATVLLLGLLVAPVRQRRVVRINHPAPIAAAEG
jgi:apolipoprotein N-acyltransferase